jgi:tRNA pseudouridine55 synthase
VHCGLLNLNKPSGMTSRRVVDIVQRLARPAKTGHAGTLDPLATGVLVVCVGPATRLIEHVQRMPKRYTGTFLLGRHSPTEDIEGEVALLADPPIPSLDQIVAAARSLTGTIQQRPPDFSALKVEGRRAYDLARRGEPVALEPRTIVVHSIDVEAYEYPELRLRIECGSGTYVRSLGRDLALQLGTAAVMSALVRTAIGPFHLADALDPQTLTRENWADHLRPPLHAVEQLPHLELSPTEIKRITSGQAIRRSPTPVDATEFAALDSSGQLVALLVPRGPGLLGPSRVFPRSRSDQGM